ncbi:MAG: hypothetical protein J6O23_09615 [Prevotella sp.]|nr:hypothetical protein [Prevotella sp.]
MAAIPVIQDGRYRPNVLHTILCPVFRSDAAPHQHYRKGCIVGCALRTG